MSFLVSRTTGGIRERYEFARSRIRRETLFVTTALVFIFLIGFLIRFTPYFKFDYVL
ncbi:hypothetical protein LCGC14_2993580, partial [marine sediment metagenome]